MSATTISPHKNRPGSKHMRRLLAKEGDGQVGIDADRLRAAAPDRHAARSARRQRRRDVPAFSFDDSRAQRRQADARGQRRTMRRQQAPCLREHPAPWRGSSPSQRRAMAAASPFSASGVPKSARRTSQPRCFRCRATTKPSPPLLPGPQSTAVKRGVQCALDRIGAGAARILHQRERRRAVSCGIAIRLVHLGDGQNLRTHYRRLGHGLHTPQRNLRTSALRKSFVTLRADRA